MPGSAKWEIEVDGVWKVPPSLELIAWLEDQYLNNKQSKVNLRGSLQVSHVKQGEQGEVPNMHQGIAH